MLDHRVRRTMKVTGAVSVFGALVIGVLTAVFELTDTVNVIGVVLGAALLLAGLAWLFGKQAPRYLPTVTTAIGIALVVAGPFLARRGDGEVYIALGVHIVVGLVVAAVGVWSGKQLRTPRVDHM